MNENLDQSSMGTRKRLPLDLLLDAAFAAARETLGTLQPLLSALPASSPERYGVSLAQQRLQMAIDQLEQMETLLAESEEERARAADIPQPGSVFDLLGWAEAGEHRAQWLLRAYQEITYHAEMLQPEIPAEEWPMPADKAIKALEALRDQVASTEGYEAVTALERAITCLQVLTNKGQHS